MRGVRCGAKETANGFEVTLLDAIFVALGY